ncbi:DUF185-domain-containing protein [Lentithecium fluviatile CBS 122367]|uniref:Protein arginine methyltransferase NDUFAF7 n=1 Tax=Lentithecium fluviatile CBS 122367 TaxID=1168545 RepID=A0A6G1J9Q1_9PLEO|nr:DUF185-domain-containing protein [Lentithecium fluviatile CBS 122367]
MRATSLNLVRSAIRCARPKAVSCRNAPVGVRWSSTIGTGEKQWSTPLAKALAGAITTTGPVSVASYMRQCLTSPDGGYYTRQSDGHDQFGAKGDFITSPEISQVFGELVGIWLYTEWLAQGKKDQVQIIEVGPGRGTLMDDVLRTISSFKPFAQSISAIYLIEASPHLRKQQAKLLTSTDTFSTSDLGESASSKHIPNCSITWCEDIRFVPKEETSTPFILAHEFFDALPIHIFQITASSKIPASATILTPTGPITPKTGPQVPKNQWHELVVAPITSSTPTTTTTTIEKDGDGAASTSKDPPPDFHLTVSKTPTPHSLYLPQTSQRYKALEKIPEAIIEISPESLSYISDFAVRIGGSKPPSLSTSKPSAQTSSQTYTPTSSTTTPTYRKSHPSGAALILDYGPSSTIPANTLRGIRSHRPCSPFILPGHVDLSADVDFLGLAESALKASPGVEVHGPVEQAFFLGTMGIKERAERLLKGTKDEEVRRRLEGAWKRLVDRGPTGMGRIYKAMAIVPFREGEEVRRPVGFGGHVVG